MRGRHRCPKTGCPEIVDNRLFACPRHWAQLSPEVQTHIHRTARPDISVAARWAALAAARDEWESCPQ